MHWRGASGHGAALSQLTNMAHRAARSYDANPGKGRGQIHAATGKSMNDLTTLQKNAAQGDAQAQVMLAFLRLTGRGLERSIPEGVRLVQAACAQNNPNALVLHAVLAARGVGRPKSLDDAYRCIRQAAELGHGPARDQLKLLGERGFDRTPWSRPVRMTQLAQAPRIFSVEGFIPKEICDWLIESARGRLRVAEVFNPSGGVMRDPARTNMVAMLELLEGDLVQQLVCRRIAIATGLPIHHQEPMNILRYLPGEEYKPHYDFIRPWAPEAQGFAAELADMGQRAATVLIYLNEEFEGGATVFPRLNLSFRGRPGDALIFWNVSESSEPERDSLHAGAPVVRGEKWLLSQWIREKPHPLI